MPGSPPCRGSRAATSVRRDGTRFGYADPLPDRCAATLEFRINRAGPVNALRLVTKNLLAVSLDPPGSVDWLMNYLVVPVPEPVDARPGTVVEVTFDYLPGDEIGALIDGIRLGTVRR